MYNLPTVSCQSPYTTNTYNYDYFYKNGSQKTNVFDEPLLLCFFSRFHQLFQRSEALATMQISANNVF